MRISGIIDSGVKRQDPVPRDGIGRPWPGAEVPRRRSRGRDADPRVEYQRRIYWYQPLECADVDASAEYANERPRDLVRPP